MNFLIISGNPKPDGLCRSVIDEIHKGAADGGARVHLLETDGIARCHVCGTGWGPCRNEHICTYGNDGFDDARLAIRQAEALCMATPVYWGEMAEGLKSFFDRLRRCEFGNTGILAGKQILLVASAGGSGNGILTCLEQMDRFCRHTGAIIFDYIGVNRWNSDYKRVSAYTCAKAMAEGRVAGKTL